MRKHYTKEFKQEIVISYENGIPAKELYKEHNIPRSILYDWIKLYKKRADKNGNVSTYQEVLNSQKKLDAMQRELEIIKRSKCLTDSPRKQKLQAIEALHGQYPVKEMCRVLEVDHATFYNYHFRRVHKTQNAIRDEILKPKIAEIFDECHQRFGAKKILIKLKEQGFKTSTDKITQLMKKMGLNPQLAKKKPFYPRADLNPRLVDRVKRDFTQEHPNTVWVGDTTSVWVDGNRFYLCAIVDLFSRKIIAHRISYKCNARLAMNTFKDAFASRGEPEGVIFHSDRGTEYTGYEYYALLKTLKVLQSFSKPGNPFDNAVIESFFSRLKNEELNRRIFCDYKSLKETVREYIDFYNSYRPHDTLGGITPNKFEEIYAENNRKMVGNLTDSPLKTV